MRYRESNRVFDEMEYMNIEWCALYFNNVDARLVEITTGRARFDKQAFRNLVQSMFIDACGGYECRDLETRIGDSNGRIFANVRMITRCFGSIITATVYINEQFYREMNIAM